MSVEEGRVKFRYDPTINLGHILTFLGYVGIMLLAYGEIRRDLAVMQENTKLQALRDQLQDQRTATNEDTMKAGLLRVEIAIDKLASKIETRGK